MRTVVLDTNVLLAHPNIVNDYPDAEVVVPEIVLGEIDKLKTARVDADLRYKGRQISRILFDLSETGSLFEGVDLPNGGRLKVVALTGDTGPKGMPLRSADDRILATAMQLCESGCEHLTLVTNDLNMLLKAQSYGISVEQTGGDGDSFSRRFIIRPFVRYRIPLTILGIAIAVFAVGIYLAAFSPLAGGGRIRDLGSLPPEYVEQMPLEQQQVLTYLIKLQTNPGDTDTQLRLANLYYELSANDPAYAQYAVPHYQAYLIANPEDDNASTDMATMLLKLGRRDQAERVLVGVLRANPDHINANFNLGVVYMSMTPPDYQKAAHQLEKVMDLTKGRADETATYSHAKTLLDQVLKDAAAAGVSIETTGAPL